MKRKKYSAAFKAKVALAALQNQMTIEEIISKFGVSKTMVYKWKSEVIEQMPNLFETKQQVKDIKAIEANYQRKIGQLTMELDFVQRVSEALGIEIPSKD